MSRRFQFTLRALLVAVVAICIGLGARHIYVMHFSSYVVAETAKVGKPIRLQSQFFLREGADSTVFWLRVAAQGYRRRLLETKGRAERIGVGTYRFSVQMPTRSLNATQCWTAPGEFDLYLQPLDGAVVTGHVVVEL